jgi:glycosyltransferase involved in cell wall biosynthesis
VNVLFVVPYVPSLVRVRSYNLVRRLSARGHRVTVATLWTNDGELADLEALRRECDQVRAFHLPAWRSFGNAVRALPTADPLQARYSWSDALMADIAAMASGHDVVHVEHLRGVRYGLRLRDLDPTTPVVWDAVDCITHLFDQSVRGRRDRVGRWINQLELARTRRFEASLVCAFEQLLVTSPVDKQAFLALSPEGLSREHRIAVVPQGVDLEHFTPGVGARESDTVVFSGKMSYHANETAALHLVQDIMPRVWARRPATRVVVVGKDPSRRLREQVARLPQVSVVGGVPDLTPYLKRAAVAAVPVVYGAGCQTKVLEAMASATPVVATPQAVSSLKTDAGQNVVVAETPTAFADGLLELLDDPRRQRAIGVAGRRYVELHHGWDRLASALELIYEALVERSGRDTIARRSRLTA